MATTLENPGQRTWSMTRDAYGHRTYKITYRVRGESTDGPATALLTPGLPQPGDSWLIDSDFDLWAWCRADADVRPVVEDEPNEFWDVTLTFSSQPPDPRQYRCQDTPIEDPLLEPPRISGGTVRYTEELTRDRNGAPILNSAFQRIRGPQVEFDRNRPTVRIDMNVPVLNLALLAGMVDKVNSATLWGLPPRTIKFSNYDWERRYYGTCLVYYHLALYFDIRYETFDRVLLDEGDMALNGHWDETTRNWILDNINGSAPDPNNPAHFMRMKDANDENITVVLDGAGQPVDNVSRGNITTTTNGTETEIVVTSATNHGLNTGDNVAVANVAGNIAANGYWQVTVLSPTTFSLDGSSSTGLVINDHVPGQGYWINLSGPGQILVQGYAEADFTLLGIPLIL